MNTIAYHATLFQNNVGTTGIAMRTPDRQVFFRDDATHTWRQLYDADAPNLHLHGRCDIVMEAAIADGNLVIKASRTLQRAA
jgi:hypothetical protein